MSIIMPALDEEQALARTLSRLPLAGREELIVVDGGSSDRTAEIARSFTDKVFITPPGRGRQMNAGASWANGDILMFLHADCALPEGAFKLVRGAMEDPQTAAGAFDVRVDHPSPWFRLIERVANARSRLTEVPYGDQALFMSRETFEKAGGFKEIPLMEDIELGRRLKRMGRMVFLRPPVTVSPRRWLREGILYTTLRDWTLATAYLWGANPCRLAKYYGNAR